MKITSANKQQAGAIAKLIMLAMNHECCQNLAGPHHTLAEFEQMMTTLVSMESSQYSYRNTLVAMTDEGEVAGICVSYDGAALHMLRQAFVQAALHTFNIDYSNMPDEATPDELYIDSLAVKPAYRKQGIATQLLQQSVAKAKALGIDKVGLLVDQGNPQAEALYTALGFKYVGHASWGGHPMKHLQFSEE